MIGGLWMTGANLNSSIYLRNNVETDPVTVTPVLYLSNGTSYTLPNVTLQPAGTAIIDINQGLLLQGISPLAPLSGYAEIRYIWPWDPFCATIRNVDVAHSLIFTYAMRPSTPTPLLMQHMPPTAQTKTIAGMWWKQESNITGFVALANISSQAANVTVQVTDNQANTLALHTATVSPHGMKFLDLTELQSAAATQGGIVITTDGTTDTLIVNGGLEDLSRGYSAILPFVTPPAQPLPPSPVSIAELGLMAGAADPMMLFPAATTFTPYSVLRNVSTAPVSVTPTIWWMQGAAAQSAHLPAIQLLPQQTQSLDVLSMLSSAGLKTYNGNFNITFDAQAAPGSLLLAAGSVDQTYTYVFEVTPRGVAESVSKSLQYWSTGNGDDTMVTVWNPADEAQNFVFKLFFSGGHYTLPLPLGPRATRTFNISEIIQNQVPDAEGNTIPASVHEGGAKIAGSLDDTQHILVAIDAGTYNVRKATCGEVCVNCDGVSEAMAVAPQITVGVGGQDQVKLIGTYGSGVQVDLTSNSTWTSSAPNVATVNSGLVTGVSAGSASIGGYDPFEAIQAGYICYGENTQFTCPEGVQATSEGSILSVTFSDIPYVLVGQTANTNATVEPTNNATPISLNVTSAAAVVSPTGTFTTNTGVTVKGLTVGGATLTATVPDPEGGPSPIAIGNISFAVTSAAPTATVTQRTSGTVSSDDIASSNYKTTVGTTNLGLIIGSGTSTGCFVGFETIGSITPSTYAGNVTLHRTIASGATYTNSTSTGSPPPGTDDTSDPHLRADNPQSSNPVGKVYDLDATGPQPPKVDGNTYRIRTNFYAYAALPGGTIISSQNYSFYVRASCTKTASGYQFVNDVPGDNQIGAGTTKTTWNLQ
jgi:hypothetical protein